MKKFVLSIAASTLAAAPAIAQDAAVQQAQPTAQQVQTAAQHYAIIAGALQSEDLPDTVKNQLFVCLYSASVRQISENVTQVLAQNEQLSADNPEHVQAAIGAVCGVQAPAAAEAAE